MFSFLQCAQTLLSNCLNFFLSLSLIICLNLFQFNLIHHGLSLVVYFLHFGVFVPYCFSLKSSVHSKSYRHVHSTLFCFQCIDNGHNLQSLHFAIQLAKYVSDEKHSPHVTEVRSCFTEKVITTVYLSGYTDFLVFSLIITEVRFFHRTTFITPLKL